ncbi:hypothetical protein MARPO_0019s0087, partial [Marchantia polymorpha]
MNIFTLLEFGKIQFEEFNCFINQGLSEELSNFPVTEDIDQEFEFQIFGEQYQLAETIHFMNSQDIFVVNGVARVIINQILRSTGIYYNPELDHNGVSIYTGTLISNWEGGLKLEIN